MFPSSKKMGRGVENVARKIGIEPKVASKTWNTMSSFTKNVSSKLLKRSNMSDSGSHSYQRLPTHLHTSNPSSNIHPIQQSPYHIIKYSLYCVLFFACIILLNFVFTKHLESKTKLLPQDNGLVFFTNKSRSTEHAQSDYDHDTINDNYGIEKDMDDLFNQINADNTTISDDINLDIKDIRDHEDPMLEEKSMQSLRDNIIDSSHDEDMVSSPSNEESFSNHVHDQNAVLDLKQHSYHPYPIGLSDIAHGTYYLCMISDMDKASKIDKYKWRSFLQHAKLTMNGNKFDIEWIPPPFAFDTERVEMVHCDGIRVNDTCVTVVIDGYMSERGRGMELSELVRFADDSLYSFDDRTGIIYEISREFEAIPRHIVMEGDGNIGKGMKIEWATYKPDEDLLYIGSIGREYTNGDGTKIRKLGLLWVVTMDRNGVIQHHDWTDKYMRLRQATATLFPGYLWIEAVEWSVIHKKWFIAPRYVSFDKYNNKETERRGCNLLIIASLDFTMIELVWIQFDKRMRKPKNDRKLNGFMSVHELNAAELRSMSVKQENMKLYLKHSNKGFSSMRFLPGTNDTMIVAIRTQENEKEIVDSFLCVFDIAGEVYFQNKRIPFQNKYEGLVVL